jgi:hypothetical protein
VLPPSERDPQDLRAARETEAAAHEAGGVGGRAPADEDPARRPVDEAGGGEAEGFERAEEDLRENAEHGQLGPRDPRRAPSPAKRRPTSPPRPTATPTTSVSTERTGET